MKRASARSPGSSEMMKATAIPVRGYGAASPAGQRTFTHGPLGGSRSSVGEGQSREKSQGFDAWAGSALRPDGRPIGSPRRPLRHGPAGVRDFSTPAGPTRVQKKSHQRNASGVSDKRQPLRAGNRGADCRATSCGSAQPYRPGPAARPGDGGPPGDTCKAFRRRCKSTRNGFCMVGPANPGRSTKHEKG